MFHVTKFLFHVHIIEFQKRLTKVENELKSMKEGTRKMDVRKEEEKKRRGAIKNMVAPRNKDDQGCYKDAAKK
jgi:hypothetical protein